MFTPGLVSGHHKVLVICSPPASMAYRSARRTRQPAMAGGGVEEKPRPVRHKSFFSAERTVVHAAGTWLRPPPADLAGADHAGQQDPGQGLDGGAASAGHLRWLARPPGRRRGISPP